MDGAKLGEREREDEEKGEWKTVRLLKSIQGFTIDMFERECQCMYLLCVRERFGRCWEGERGERERERERKDVWGMIAR